MKIAVLLLALVGGCAACETAYSDTDQVTVGGYDMGNLPASRTVTLVPSDPAPSNLLNELQDVDVALNRLLTGQSQSTWPANPVLAGNLTVGGSLSLSGALLGALQVNVISPSLVAGNNNDFNPTGLAGAVIIMANAAAAATLTGLTGGVTGRIIHIINVSGSTITITNQDISSSNGNRFITPSGATLTLTGSSSLSTSWMYDGITWRLISKTF